MRDYATVSPTFWTGRTGRAIKAKGSDAIIAALYLVTCPSSSMTGLYYLPVPTLAHETGLPLEGASKALRSLREVGFADYDEANEVVLVREMARYQIGESITATDNRSKGAIRDAKRCSHSPLFAAWFARYRTAFNLPESEAPKAVEVSPSEAPPKPLRSQDQEQDHEQEQGIVAAPPAPPTPPLALEPPAEKPAKAKRPKADKPAPPFSVAEALNAIASTAGRRFTTGDATTWAPGWKIAIAQHVRRFPDLATWRLVGEWLSEGGASWAPTHGPQWAASNHLLDAITKSQAWASSGRGVVDAKAAVTPQVPAVAAPTASQPHAPKKVFLGEEFAAAAKAARESK